MSKSLSPPEVVQALLDGRTLAFNGNLFCYRDGCFASRPQGNPAGAPWGDVAWRAGDFLETFIGSHPWTLAPDTYDLAEARRRGERHTVRLRSVVSKKEYMFPLDPNVQLRLFEIDGQWCDA